MPKAKPPTKSSSNCSKMSRQNKQVCCSSKPRRGDLFIASNDPDQHSFCFSAARQRPIRARSFRAGCFLTGSLLPDRAAEKQKENKVWLIVGYKQVTPTGFSDFFRISPVGLRTSS